MNALNAGKPAREGAASNDKIRLWKDGDLFTAEIDDGELSQVLDLLAETAGLNLALYGDIRETVRLKLHEVSLESLFESLFKGRRYSFVLENKTLYVSEGGAPNVGSIASVGATRETFAQDNFNFGSSLLINALSGNGETIGSAMLKSKRAVGMIQSSSRYNNERYVLLGEPVIRMPSSDLKVTLDKSLDSIKALDRMTLSGTVEGLDNGYVNLELREGRTMKRMALNVSSDSVDVFYDGGLIYSEKIPVKGGRFTTDFVTPRKISIGDTTAEFSAWAYSSNENAVGRSWIRKLVVSGVSDYADSLNVNFMQC